MRLRDPLMLALYCVAFLVGQQFMRGKDLTDLVVGFAFLGLSLLGYSLTSEDDEKEGVANPFSDPVT